MPDQFSITLNYEKGKFSTCLNPYPLRYTDSITESLMNSFTI